MYTCIPVLPLYNWDISTAVLSIGEQGYWEGRANNREGWFPSNCVEEVHLRRPIPGNIEVTNLAEKVLIKCLVFYYQLICLICSCTCFSIKGLKVLITE